jgi:ABC-type phosphate transport system permease subunit
MSKNRAKKFFKTIFLLCIMVVLIYTISVKLFLIVYSTFSLSNYVNFKVFALEYLFPDAICLISLGYILYRLLKRVNLLYKQ